jgi:cell surface protein SprA
MANKSTLYLSGRAEHHHCQRQPDLSKVRVYMLGVRNPLRSLASPGLDDGLDKTAQIWFNEMRLTILMNAGAGPQPPG